MNEFTTLFFKKYAGLFVYAVAMGILEAVVVVYVRALYYPGGFEFPLKFMEPKMVEAELVRELCTLIMLVSVAWITRKTKMQKLAAFIFMFAVWDIFYYVGLKVFLNWPESFLTWDVLFLIPVIWTGPLLAPLICSGMMILLAVYFEWIQYENHKMRTNEFLLIITGAVIFFISFIWDAGKIVLKKANSEAIKTAVENYIPEKFHWEIFVLGILFTLAGVFLNYRMFIKKVDV